MTSSSTAGAPAMISSRAPSRVGAVAGVGLVLSLLMIALGVVAMHDVLVSAGAVDGGSWIEGAIDAVDGLTAQWWMVPVGLAMLLLGLWMLWISVRPRRARAAAVRSATGVFLSPRDLRILARRAAEDVDGVLAADVQASRSAVRVSASVTSKDDRIDADIRAAVERATSGLERPPGIRVRTREQAS